MRHKNLYLKHSLGPRQYKLRHLHRPNGLAEDRLSMARQRLLNLGEFQLSLRQHKLRHLHSPNGLVADHLSMGRPKLLGLTGLRLSPYQMLRRWKLQFLSPNAADLRRGPTVLQSLSPSPSLKLR
jgi:hypothetical protein